MQKNTTITFQNFLNKNEIDEIQINNLIENMGRIKKEFSSRVD